MEEREERDKGMEREEGSKARKGEELEEASKEVSREFRTLIDGSHMDTLNQTQILIIGRMQDSNAVLGHFNDYSENCLAEVSGDLADHTRLLKSLKSDLDYVFLKLRSMKAKLLATYPDAFQHESTEQVLDRRPDLELP